MKIRRAAQRASVEGGGIVWLLAGLLLVAAVVRTLVIR